MCSVTVVTFYQIMKEVKNNHEKSKKTLFFLTLFFKHYFLNIIF